jgi:hypothetical protein
MVAKRFLHPVETKQDEKYDEQEGHPEHAVAGKESAKNKTKQESHHSHLPAHLLPLSQFAVDLLAPLADLTGQSARPTEAFAPELSGQAGITTVALSLHRWDFTRSNVS